MEECIRKKRKRKLGEENRVGNGERSGDVLENCEGMEAAMEKEQMENFWDVKIQSKCAELGRMQKEGERKRDRRRGGER